MHSDSVRSAHLCQNRCMNRIGSNRPARLTDCCNVIDVDSQKCHMPQALELLIPPMKPASSSIQWKSVGSLSKFGHDRQNGNRSGCPRTGVQLVQICGIATKLAFVGVRAPLPPSPVNPIRVRETGPAVILSRQNLSQQLHRNSALKTLVLLILPE